MPDKTSPVAAINAVLNGDLVPNDHTVTTPYELPSQSRGCTTKELPQQLDQLDSLSDKVTSRINDLETMLRPVMLPLPPVEPIADDCPETELAQRLCTCNERLLYVYEKLGSIMNQLQV